MRRVNEEPAVPPSNCPFCNSKAVVVKPQGKWESNYWRCETCGQLWHPQRLQRSALLRFDARRERP